MRYAAASPIRPVPSAPIPDWGRVADAVWRRVEAAHPQARKSGGTEYTRVEVCGNTAFEGIVPFYVRICGPATIDPILAISKMLHETGDMSSWWAGKPRRNPAGIFVTGAKATTPKPTEPGLWHWKGADARFYRGGVWDNWLDTEKGPGSISAHVWRLAGYALERFSPTQQALYDAAVRGRPLPEACRGSAGNWRELGWAFNRRKLQGIGWAFPGWNYGNAIAAIANAITKEAF